ncbi:MAG: chemotaxis protein CheW, partial [Geopsychrobacter sp.]|nr:chemotaxis protein CheW [Geopsychrobacter sp.]
MMDLADIRKKARAQNNPVVLDSLLPSEVITAEVPHCSSSPVNEISDHCFWDEIGTEQFATEEEYSQGLTGAGDESDVAQVQWLSFYLGKEEYALDIQEVSELIKPRVLTELPQVPSYLCGIITLRGEVIPVIDLKIRLGLVSIEPVDIDLQRVVVCEGKDQRVGLLVDQISQV